MSLGLPSDIDTGNSFVPIVKAGKQAKLAGVDIHFATVADLAAAVAIEAANAGAALPIWLDGATVRVATELGAVRIWDAVALNARRVRLRPGLVVALASDTATVLATSGPPASGSGTAGDLAVDYASNLYYTRGASAWACTGPIYPPSRKVGPGTLVIAGHSRVQRHYAEAAAGSNGGRTVTLYPRAWMWANVLLNGVFNIVGNAGVNGETLDGLAARLANASAGVGFGALGSDSLAVSTAPGVLPLDPEWVGLDHGINDLLGGATAATAYAKLVSICRLLVAAGAKVVLMTQTAPSSGQGASASVQGQIIEFNRLILTTNIDGVIPVDTAGPCYDNSQAAGVYSPVSLFMDSNLHENNRGGYRQGKALAAALRGRVSAQNPLLPTSAACTSAVNSAIQQLLPDPLLLQTAALSGTGISGTGPAGWTLLRGNGTPTAVGSMAARADGLGNEVVLDITSSTALDVLQARGPSLLTSLVPGGRYVALMAVSLAGASGAALTTASNVAGLKLQIQHNDGSTNNFCSVGTVSGGSDVPLEEGFTGVLQTPTFSAPLTGAPTTFRFNFDVAFSTATSGACQVRMSRVAFWRVG